MSTWLIQPCDVNSQTAWMAETAVVRVVRRNCSRAHMPVAGSSRWPGSAATKHVRAHHLRSGFHRTAAATVGRQEPPAPRPETRGRCGPWSTARDLTRAKGPASTRAGQSCRPWSTPRRTCRYRGQPRARPYRRRSPRAGSANRRGGQVRERARWVEQLAAQRLVPALQLAGRGRRVRPGQLGGDPVLAAHPPEQHLGRAGPGEPAGELLAVVSTSAGTPYCFMAATNASATARPDGTASTTARTTYRE